VRCAERSQTRARLDQQGVAVTVIAAFELDYPVTPGESSGQPDRAHRGFRSGADQTNFLDRRKRRDYLFGQLYFDLGRGAIAGSSGGRALDRVDDRRVPVAEYHRSP